MTIQDRNNQNQQNIKSPQDQRGLKNRNEQQGNRADSQNPNDPAFEKNQPYADSRNRADKE